MEFLDNICLDFFYEPATMERSHCEHSHVCQCFVNSGKGRKGGGAYFRKQDGLIKSKRDCLFKPCLQVVSDNQEAGRTCVVRSGARLKRAMKMCAALAKLATTTATTPPPTIFFEPTDLKIKHTT